jgi:hypothetical protein
MGFEGLLCDQVANPCLKQKSPCLNGGQCVFDTACKDNFKCKCPPGFTGLQCQTDVDECLSSPCLNGGRCVDRRNGYECQCRGGFSGKNCQDEARQLKVKACMAFACQNNATCRLGSDGPECLCASGFFGSRCDRSVQAECRDRICANGGRCQFNEKDKTIECLCARGNID